MIEPGVFANRGNFRAHLGAKRFELTQRSAEISARLPGRPRLKFVPGPLPDEAPDTSSQPALEATPEQVREAQSLAAAIDDPKLRESVVKVIKAALARASNDRSV